MKSRATISGMVLLVAVFWLLIGATHQMPKAPFAPTPMQLPVPAGWPEPNYALFANNPITVQGFELGREFFYDGRLSKDGLTSCGSCHQQFAAFSQLDHDFSHAIFDSFTTRNTPALINLAWQKNWHWDGGINHIEQQPIAPITKPNEMGETLENVLRMANADSAYQRMAYAAFGTSTITTAILTKSIAQFMAMMVSRNSKYDRVMAGKDTFQTYEARGYEIFKAKCNACHTAPLFTDNQFRNNGMPLNRLKDVGRMDITGKPTDSLKFKVPSLRNVKWSFPFMHDGSLYALPNVVDHYRNLDTSKQNLDPILKTPIVLNDREKMWLIQFLYTLTDDSLLIDPKFAPRRLVHIKH